jgi:RNA polymerase-binding transcription factor DksA
VKKASPAPGARAFFLNNKRRGAVKATRRKTIKMKKTNPNASLEQIEKKLKAEKENIEKELRKIAVPNKNVPGDWQSKFPYGNGDSGTASLERQADEVEEYTTRLPLEHNLENKLSLINSAIDKIAKGTYGKCGKCGKNIPLERLDIFPEANFCVDCQE